MLTITSAQNPRVKAAVRLRESRARRKQGLFLIDGAREISRAIDAGVEIDEAFLCAELCTSVERQTAARRAGDAARRSYLVTPDVFSKLAFGHRAEGTVAVAVTRPRTLQDLVIGAAPLVAIVEGVEKPGNFGAILRSADAAGVSAVIAADGGHDLFNPNTIRASLGAIFALPVCEARSVETRDWLRMNGIAMYAAYVGGGVAYTSVDYRRPAAFVLGSEAEGLSDTWRTEDVTQIELPMRGVVDSLNVSTAAAILFYEALRQRLAT